MTIDTNTVNGIDWEVQTYSEDMGWINRFTTDDDKPRKFPTKVRADAFLKSILIQPNKFNVRYRVYEALDLAHH